MTAQRFPIEQGHVLAFARAIGDFNPVYCDEAAARDSEVAGIVAPPTFVQASAQFDEDYPLRPKPGRAWFGSGATPTGADASAAGGDGPSRGGTGLHAEQHYEYFAPLRPGDVLSIRMRDGETWQKEGRRGGVLTFHESITEYRNQTGALVVVARAVGVRTSKTVGS